MHAAQEDPSITGSHWGDAGGVAPSSGKLTQVVRSGGHGQKNIFVSAPETKPVEYGAHTGLVTTLPANEQMGENTPGGRTAFIDPAASCDNEW